MNKCLAQVHNDPGIGGLAKVSWQMHFIKGDATNCTATKGLKAFQQGLLLSRLCPIIPSLRWQRRRCRAGRCRKAAPRPMLEIREAHVVSIKSVVRINAQNFGLESDFPDVDDLDGDAWLDTCLLWEQRVFPDLALVPPECDGIATRALFHRQLESAGAPTWLDPRPSIARKDKHIRCFFWGHGRRSRPGCLRQDCGGRAFCTARGLALP